MTTKLEIRSCRDVILATTEQYTSLTDWGKSGNLSGAYLSSAYLSGADLSRAYLSGADLTGADLTGADLSRANLGGANLTGADLTGANLRGADLSGADLSGADLSGAYLRGANLRGADLRGADLSRADLGGADLGGADLRGANLSGAKGLLGPTEWLKAHFETDAEGVIVYKRIGLTEYSAPDHWIIERGAYLAEVVNPIRTTDCACGVNFGTLEWCEAHYKETVLWRCRIEWMDLAGVVVPYNTDGKARCARLRLIEPVMTE